MKEHKTHYINGQIMFHYWRNDKDRIEGETKNWHENGQLASQGFYKNGLIQGEYKSWWSNGQLAIHCFFKNGLKEGETKNWHSNGQLDEHIFYHNDEEIDITVYVADKNNITEQEYFHLQLAFGYFPVIKYDGIEQ